MQLLAACRDYFAKTGRRISFEYTMIDGVSDSAGAGAAAGKETGTECGAHVNMIPLNNVHRERPAYFVKAGYPTVFRPYLKNNGITATLRRTLGSDIDASCGQLRRKYESN